MRSGTDRDAPQPIEPPTGTLEVYTYDPKTGRATLVESCGEDIARAEKVLRRLDGPACRARGGVVIGVRYGTQPSLVAPMKAAVMVAYAARKLAHEAPHTDVEPKAPSTTSNDEEPMTTDETPRCEGHDCEEPRGGVRTDTKPELEGFCPRHRKIAVDRARSSGVSLKEAAVALREGRAVEAAPSKSSKTPKSKKTAKKPPRKAAKVSPETAAPQSNDPMAPLREALDALVSNRSNSVSEDDVRRIFREMMADLLVRPS